MPLRAVDAAADDYASNLIKVLDELETRLIGVLGQAKSARDTFDAATLLNSRGDMLQALRESGYFALANEHVNKYPGIVEAVKKDFAARDLPPAVFTKPNADLFSQIAMADLSMFSAIGEKAIADLHYELYRHALSSRPFSDMVRVIKASTVGTSVKGSPLRNYSYTHANTAILNFSGEVIREAGESIGAKNWKVLGPLDSLTRPVCRAAFSDRVRTEEEWKDAGYWGGTPGGYNCRHQLYPSFDDA